MKKNKTVINQIIDGYWNGTNIADNQTNILHKYYSFSTILEKLMDDDFGISEFDNDEEYEEFKSENFDETTDLIYLN